MIISRSIQPGAFMAAALCAAGALGAIGTAAPAQARDGAYYQVQLAAPAEKETVIAGGVAWTCKGTSCVAAKGTSRPARMCRELKRDLGEIVAFTTEGEALDADKLSRCNR
ncbi:CC_3452 family protein [Qipengyuania sp. NPDC077563]|uniref:CC_3452 family protein n=1 Tax=Qipengyuania sp. NPDC077563 TaxID=3364497 RepID=UPI00384BE4D6